MKIVPQSPLDDYCKDRILIENFQYWFRKNWKNHPKYWFRQISWLKISKRRCILLHSKFYWNRSLNQAAAPWLARVMPVRRFWCSVLSGWHAAGAAASSSDTLRPGVGGGPAGAGPAGRLFQSLVPEFGFTFKCPLEELPAFQVARAVTGQNSSYVLICTHTHHICNTYIYGLLRPNYV